MTASKKIFYLFSVTLLLVVTNHFNKVYAQSYSWQKIGNPKGVQVQDISYDPKTHKLAAATQNGLYVSTDDGESWIRKPFHKLDINIYSAAISGDTIYMGIEGDVFHSFDGGESWSNGRDVSKKSDLEAILPLGLVLLDNQVLIARTDRGVYRSTNGGVNWTVIGNIDRVFVRDLEKIGENLFVTNIYGLYMSSDKGATWTKTGSSTLANYDPYKIAMESSSQTLFLSCLTEGGFLRSTDFGQTWAKVEGFPTGSVPGYLGIVNNTISCVMIKNHSVVGLFQSTDAGKNWSKTTDTYPYTDIYTAGNILLYGLDSGICKSTDNGKSWSVVTNGLRPQLMTMLLTSEGTLLASAFTRGIFRSTNDGMTWDRVYNGVANQSLVKYRDSYFASVNNGIIRSTNDGRTWDSVTNPGTYPNTVIKECIMNEKGWFAIVFDFTSFATSIYRSTDNGNSWTQTDIPPGLFSHMYSTGDSIYVLNNTTGLGEGCSVYRSYDNGESWKQIQVPADFVLCGTFYNGKFTIGTGAGIYTADQDTSWVRISDGDVIPSALYSYYNRLFAGSDIGVTANPLSGLSWDPAGLTDDIILLAGNKEYLYAVSYTGELYKANIITSGIQERTLTNSSCSVSLSNNQALLNVTLSKTGPGTLDLQLFDITGKLVYAESRVVASENATLTIPTNNFLPEIYFYQARINSQQYTGKFLLTR